MRTLVLGFALLATLVLATAATAASSDNSPGAVYTLTNSPAGNAVAGGVLQQLLSFPRGEIDDLEPGKHLFLQ